MCVSYLKVICARPWESKEAFGDLRSPKQARKSLIPEATSRERPQLPHVVSFKILGQDPESQHSQTKPRYFWPF